MRTIYKYPLSITGGIQTVTLPQDARILTVQMQGGAPCLWAEVNGGNRPGSPGEAEDRDFQIFGTGHEIPADRGDEGFCFSYVGTVQQGQFV